MYESNQTAVVPAGWTSYTWQTMKQRRMAVQPVSEKKSLLCDGVVSCICTNIFDGNEAASAPTLAPLNASLQMTIYCTAYAIY